MSTSPRRCRYRLLRLGAGLSVVGVLLLVGATKAWAHAFPVDTTPEAGARLVAAPSEVSVHFSEAIVPSAARLIVRTPTGRSIAIGRLEVLEGDTTMQAFLVHPPRAIYVVSWSVTAIDGHESAGEFAFAAGRVRGRLPTPSIHSASIPVPDSIATVLLLGGLAVAFGGLISERFVWRPVESDEAAAPKAPVAAALVIGLVGAATQLVLVARGQPDGLLATTSWRDALASRPGILAVAELVALAYALWVLRVPRFRPLAIVPLAGAVVAAAFRGHSGATSQWWAAPANTVHFVLAGVWVGALVHLVRVLWRVPHDRWRSTVGVAASRYASVALATVPPLLVFGVITALAELDTLDDLTTTTYGRVLLVKTGLVFGALSLALTARLRALRPGGFDLGALRRLTRPEAITLLAVIAATGVLASTTPGSSASAASYILGPPPLTGTVERSADLAGQLAVYLAATDGGLRLETLAPGSTTPADDLHVEVEGTRPDGTPFALFPRRCGPGCATVRVDWATGVTALTATIHAIGWTGGRARFTVSWPPGLDATASLEHVIAAMRAQPHVEVNERVSSGPRARAIPNAGDFSGADFMAQELYANGGATDIRARPPDGGLQDLTLSVPASDLWLRLWYDDTGLIRRELIIDPGHRIERTFTYTAADQ